MQDHPSHPLSGWMMLGVLLILAVIGLGLFFSQQIPIAVLTGVLTLFLATGLFILEPNQAGVLSLFGDYKGTVQETGLLWTNPLYSVRKVSVRIANFETGKLKVNDKEGNPIEIGAVVVWRVQSPAEAVYNVDDYASFVEIQSEAALRTLASGYSYDSEDDEDDSLRSQPDAVSRKLQEQIHARLDKAGVDIIEARVSHLAYAPEIAQAMLQRQQASAMVAARTQLVKGATSMVQMALEELRKNNLDVESEAARQRLVADLLVVLCSGAGAQPVLSVGQSSS